MNLSASSHVHFIAICGTAMGSVAAMLKEQGHTVTGSDENVYPPMSSFLAESGVRVLEGFDADHLVPAPDLVVIGNAMSRGNPEVEAILERKLRYVSLPEILKESFIRGRTSLVASGTHGKTTTSSMLAWMLDQAGLDPGFMIGGIPENFGGGARNGGGEFFVCEGDEYDTAFFDKRSKFVHYLPDGLIINNIEFDHGDIFDDIDDILLSFRRLVVLIPRNGVVLAAGGDPNVAAVLDTTHCPVESFGLDEGSDWIGANVRLNQNRTSFDVVRNNQTMGRCDLPMLGEHNVKNALGVIALASHYGVAVEDSCRYMADFKGVRRRLQIASNVGGRTLFDDFAHHPTAIAATLKTVRDSFPDCRLWAVIEPRSNTAVRSILQQELTQALGLADRAVIGPIHRLDKVPKDERLDVDAVIGDLAALGCDGIHITDPDKITQLLDCETRTGDVVVIMSNGGFGGLVKKTADLWESDYQDRNV